MPEPDPTALALAVGALVLAALAFDLFEDLVLWAHERLSRWWRRAR